MRNKNQICRIFILCILAISMICTFLSIITVKVLGVSSSVSFINLFRTDGILDEVTDFFGTKEDITALRIAIIIHILLNLLSVVFVRLKNKLAFVMNIVIGSIQFAWWSFAAYVFYTTSSSYYESLDFLFDVQIGLGLWGYILTALGVVILSIIQLFFLKDTKKNTVVEKENTTGAIIGLSGEYAGAKIPVDNFSVILGRDQNLCQLVFHGEKISRKHCSVSYDASRKIYVVLDFSMNGTFLNDGVRLLANKENELQPGSQIYIDEQNAFLLE